jgi:hypothetical protein
MPIILVTSSEAKAGRSVVAAATAYRAARAGKTVTLARVDGDAAAARDALTFASLEYLASGGKPVTVDDVTALSSVADVVVLEAPAGDAPAVPGDTTMLSIARFPGTGGIVTAAPAAEAPAVRERGAVLAVLPEDRVLAAPSVDDIAAALKGTWLVEPEARGSIDRIMIGTVASDAASPYFGNRERTCVVTRYDKTDIQLAALLTDLELLVLTGGGQPSPYLIDRVENARERIGLLLVEANTVDAMRGIEALYGTAPFDGMGKLMRAVELLDEQGAPVFV